MGHLKEFGNPESDKQSYLSPNIYEEIVLVMTKYVEKYILAELKTTKYFSVSVSSTPDLAHVDHLTVFVRYVVSRKLVESFFFQYSCRLAFTRLKYCMATSLLEFLKKEGISFEDCRGQSFDNASNMVGHYTGTQSRLKNKNPTYVFIPCAAHSLNLVGHVAASCCVEAVSCFGFIQRLYTFFCVNAQVDKSNEVFGRKSKNTYCEAPVRHLLVTKSWCY